jgi:hypothetical protein
MAEEARKRGYELPPPFGVSVVYNYLARDIEITDVRLGVNGGPLTSVSQYVDFGARSTVGAVLLKTDAWLLPFLNVYLLAGYIDNVSDTNIAVTLPIPPPLPGSQPIAIKKQTTLHGFVGGGGMTLAGGYKQLFVMADANYTQTDLGFDDSFRAIIVSARAGWNGKLGKTPFRAWLGAAYWDTRNTARGSVEVPGVGTLQFEADQGPKNPWNMTVGATGVVHRRQHHQYELFAEYGWSPGDLVFFAGGLTLRF